MDSYNLQGNVAGSAGQINPDILCTLLLLLFPQQFCCRISEPMNRAKQYVQEIIRVLGCILAIGSGV